MIVVWCLSSCMFSAVSHALYMLAGYTLVLFQKIRGLSEDFYSLSFHSRAS